MGGLYGKMKIYGFRKFMLYAYKETMRFILRKLLLGSYSQDGEDLIVEGVLKRLKVRKGIIVDIGANDGLRFNNTYRFSKKGWKCVNVEPNPVLFDILRRTRRDDININAGIARDKGVMTFYRIFPETLGTFSGEQARASIKDGFKLIGEISVDVGSLEDVFQRYSEGEGIAFLSVDTEGFDLQVLESNNWAKYRPAVLCIEKGSDPAVLKLMEKSGYDKISETHINTIFILKQDN